jgi:hypothetical protein
MQIQAPLEKGLIQFRFHLCKSEGKIIFDDVSITYNDPVPFCVPGYNDLLVKNQFENSKRLKTRDQLLLQGFAL